MTQTLDVLCYNKNLSLKKYSTNFIQTWIRPLYFGQFISGYLTVFDSGIFPNFLKFPLDRPEAYPDFFQIFLWMRIRDVTWNSRVLEDPQSVNDWQFGIFCDLPSTCHCQLSERLRDISHLILLSWKYNEKLLLSSLHRTPENPAKG